MDKAKRLRKYLHSSETTFLMEAHNGLSAKIVEEAGFQAIWASGFTIGAALGLRDADEVSSTQLTNMLEFMNNATTLPILADGAAGYGNFNHVRLLVRKLCQTGIAGVCIADRIYPKAGGLLERTSKLTEMQEFCGKIKAGKDAQTHPQFVMVARSEALTAGLGMDEALRRAEAYHEAGADAIVVDSRKTTADEVLGFAKRWQNRCPLIVIPSQYYKTPTLRFREADIAMIIWANQTLRAAVKGMRETLQRIRMEESLINLEHKIPKVEDIFKLTNEQELKEAEKRYLLK